MRSVTLTAAAILLCAVAGLSATTVQDNPPSLDTYNGCPMIGDGQSA